MGEVETKLVLVGHIKLDEGGGPQTEEAEKGEGKARSHANGGPLSQ